MSLKDQLERIIALEQTAEKAVDDRSERGDDDEPGIFAPLIAVLRDLKASLERRPKH